MQHETSWTIEAWRGIAAWMVVYAHFWAGPDNPWPLLQFAYTGVDLFFVLSGFVFAPYFFGKKVDLPGFAVRRFFRIYPTFFLAMCLYVALAWIDGKALLHLWQHFTFLYLQSREMAFYYNPAFWSLPSEVAFYMVLPWCAWGCRRDPRLFVLIVCVALLLRLVLGWNSDPHVQNNAYIFLHHLPGIWLEFMLGVCAWKLANQHVSIFQKGALFMGGMLLWCLLAYWFALVGDIGIHASWARGQTGWLAALAFAAMVAATATPPTARNSTLAACALWAGRLSYGSYLFHNAMLHIIVHHTAVHDAQWQRFIAACATLVLAWCVFVAWENPWRRWGRSFANKH